MCFGMTTTAQQTNTPSATTQAAGQDVYNFAKNLTSSGFNAPLQSIVGFNPTQTSAFTKISDLANSANANNPFYSTTANDYASYGSAPASKISTPSVLGGGTNAATASLSDYIDPNLQLELNPTLQNISRQANISKTGAGGIGSSATAAGAFGDARQGVENANVDEAAMRQAAQATAGAYQNAFTNAASLRNTDISNLINTQTTNANLNETALNRMLGSGNALTNLANYQTSTASSLAQNQLSAGTTQQQNAQQSANASYNQALQNLLGPYQYEIPALTSSASTLASTQPSTTTTQQPNNALWNLLGTVLGSASTGFGQGMGSSYGKSLFNSATG